MAEWICPNCSWKNITKWDRCAKCGYPQHPTVDQIESYRAEKEKQENFLFSTTPNLQGKQITNYHGVISSVVALGTGLLSDLNATISDLTGGRSTGYQKKLQEATDTLLNEMRVKATSKNDLVNGIIGLRIDYTTTSTSNMMLVCGTGTAIEYQPENN